MIWAYIVEELDESGLPDGLVNLIKLCVAESVPELAEHKQDIRGCGYLK